MTPLRNLNKSASAMPHFSMNLQIYSLRIILMFMNSQLLTLPKSWKKGMQQSKGAPLSACKNSACLIFLHCCCYYYYHLLLTALFSPCILLWTNLFSVGFAFYRRLDVISFGLLQQQSDNNISKRKFILQHFRCD